MTERIRTSEGALTAGAGPAGGRPAPSTAPRTPSGVYTPTSQPTNQTKSR
jgi:hypothetical protein